MNGWLVWVQDQADAVIQQLSRIAEALERIADQGDQQLEEANDDA